MVGKAAGSRERVGQVGRQVGRASLSSVSPLPTLLLTLSLECTTEVQYKQGWPARRRYHGGAKRRQATRPTPLPELFVLKNWGTGDRPILRGETDAVRGRCRHSMVRSTAIKIKIALDRQVMLTFRSPRWSLGFMLAVAAIFALA
jgi:hypothetical protein